MTGDVFEQFKQKEEKKHGPRDVEGPPQDRGATGPGPTHRTGESPRGEGSGGGPVAGDKDDVRALRWGGGRGRIRRQGQDDQQHHLGGGRGGGSGFLTTSPPIRNGPR